MYLWSGLCHKPCWGRLHHSPRPLDGGEGEGSLSPPKNPPLSAIGWNFGPSGLRSPPKDTGSVCNQNCCKGFRFTEKVEKHCANHYTTKSSLPVPVINCCKKCYSVANELECVLCCVGVVRWSKPSSNISTTTQHFVHSASQFCH